MIIEHGLEHELIYIWSVDLYLEPFTLRNMIIAGSYIEFVPEIPSQMYVLISFFLFS